ncbi:uncharacterized protein LOC112012066 [Rhizophagus clarus]|uniref:Uncharacterized protein LOC112012066 n=1 Tax=Rhizophagus clarus TaxID=94130 RepID=A0A8H3LNH2_9GLOM|nr:uncharacterized protein LOC112012066 [Rhizophagus clarus]
MTPEQEAAETPQLRQRRLTKERQTRFRKRQKNNERGTDELGCVDNGITRHELGRMDQTCVHCGAKFWLEEKDHNSSHASPTFSFCCAHGKVLLPHLHEPPPYLLNLYTSSECDAISFHKNIRRYNNVLACTSFGASIDTIPGQGISNFRIHGQVYHLIGSLLPEEGQQPAFAQLYIYDSEHENEHRNNVIQELDNEILQNLLKMLDECNPYIQNFRHIRDLIKTNTPGEIFMIIHGDRTRDPHHYNAPTASEVAAIMVGNGYELHTTNRDILLRMHDGCLQRISEIHPSYDPLHYILLFPRGDDGWHVDVPLIGATKEKEAGRLYQQYIIDQYAKVEQNRLNYLRHNQASLRTDLYNGVSDAIHTGDSTQVGQRIILPSSFAGGPRQMYQLYQDAMTIVSYFGKPDLFVTFTCNPKWPEITRELLPHQTPEDKLRSTDNYDSIVSAEIPNPVTHPLAYETVSKMMMHGPCGVINPAAPCMKDGVCQKHYPKSFHENTQKDNNGYPTYRRRNNGCFVEISNGFRLDNRWVVPHNVDLVTKHNAHINVEICSSVLSIKYLYKYVYKGHDRATITLYHENIQRILDHQAEPIDEIKLYLDARYVSASESIWRIFHYRMHGRSPKVQRLAVHLPNHQYITFQDGEDLQDVIDRANSRKTTLTAWFQENMDNDAARMYTYGEFPNYYTWDMKQHMWRPRKTATIMIGRIYMVQPSEGERYYLCILLTHVRGATSFENLKTIDGYTCGSFKEACIRLSLLQDDDEWNACLLEASAIQSGKQLRHLFVSILLFCQPVNPEILWNDHKVALCEDICYQNHVLIQSQNDNIPDIIEREALYQLEDILLLNGKLLKNFPNMPIPPTKTSNINYYNEDWTN